MSKRGGIVALFAIACTLMSVNALAVESFNARLRQAHDLLQSGDPDGALAHYRELQTEDPESETLYYSIGCAEYEQGRKLVDQQAPRDAVNSFKAAKESFEKVVTARNPEIRMDAAFNHANCAAQIAEQSMAAQQYDDTKKAFEESVKEYEEFLRQHPDHEGARTNLNHIRYLLKSMLQNPPPPQEQQQQGQGQDEKKDEKKDEQQQEQGQDRQKDQEQQDQDKQDQDKQEQQKAEKEEQQQQAQAAQPEDENKPEQSAEDLPPDDKQNADAILQSLEDVDKREQQEMRNPHGNVRVPKEWW